MTPSTSSSSTTLNTKAKLRYSVWLRKTHSSTCRPSSTLCSTGTHHVMNLLPTGLSFTSSFESSCFVFFLQREWHSRSGNRQLLCYKSRLVPQWGPELPGLPVGSAVVRRGVLQSWGSQGGSWRHYVCKRHQHITWQKVLFSFCMCSFPQEYSQFFSTGLNVWCSSCRYIYIADIMDHEIDVYERQDGEQLVYLKVI